MCVFVRVCVVSRTPNRVFVPSGFSFSCDRTRAGAFCFPCPALYFSFRVQRWLICFREFEKVTMFRICFSAVCGAFCWVIDPHQHVPSSFRLDFLVHVLYEVLMSFLPNESDVCFCMLCQTSKTRQCVACARSFSFWCISFGFPVCCPVRTA